MPRGCWLVLLAGACRAQVEGGAPIDAAPDGAPADAALDAPGADARPCLGGDTRMTAPDGSCLVMINAPQTYANATAACTALSARLIIIRDSATDLVAHQLVGARDTFIGLTDQVAEGAFRWVDGSAPVYTNWDPTEPNDGGGVYPEDCAIIAGGRGAHWDDRPCAPVAGVGGGMYATLCQY